MKCIRKDCFAFNPCRENNCNALENNFFHGEPCPFYKNYKEMAEEIEKQKGKNKDGRQAL